MEGGESEEGEGGSWYLRGRPTGTAAQAGHTASLGWGDTHRLLCSCRFSQTSLHLQEQDQISQFPDPAPQGQVGAEIEAQPSPLLPWAGLRPDVGAEPLIAGGHLTWRGLLTIYLGEWTV